MFVKHKFLVKRTPFGIPSTSEFFLNNFHPIQAMQWIVSKSKISIHTLCLVMVKTYYSSLPPGRRAIIKVNNFPKIVY